MQAHWEHQLINLAGKVPTPAAGPFNSYWAGDIGLQKGYRLCAAVTARHSKSFHLASGLLPEEKRSAIRALYAFSRAVDDIVDEPSTSDPRHDLDYWRKVVESASAPQDDLIAAAWADTLNRYRIPRHLALQLIDGVARDLSRTCYASFADLSLYCYGVASTVGLMSMCIVGFKSDEAVPYAIKLGVALQLTNILRDVAADARSGRIYLPQDELAGFGISERDLWSGRVSETWREFMRFQIDRTRGLYHDARPGYRLLSRDGQLAVAAAADFYEGILEQIEANDYDVFRHRAHLSPWQKVSRLPSLWWQWCRQ